MNDSSETTAARGFLAETPTSEEHADYIAGMLSTLIEIARPHPKLDLVVYLLGVALREAELLQLRSKRH